MVDSSGIRVADADRELVAGELREHMMAGRLTSEEFEERVARAYAAVTRAQLDELRADLPMGVATIDKELAARHARLRRRLVQEGGGAIGLSGLAVAIWAASGASGGFWPAWVIVVTLLPVVRNAWRLLGPDPDPERVEASLNRRRERGLARERHRARHRELPR